jgi:hypothetical protein
MSSDVESLNTILITPAILTETRKKHTTGKTVHGITWEDIGTVRIIL